jgi:hypothetical protein
MNVFQRVSKSVENEHLGEPLNNQIILQEFLRALLALTLWY